MRDRELKEIRKQEQYMEAISCMEEEQYGIKANEFLFEGTSKKIMKMPEIISWE